MTTNPTQASFRSPFLGCGVLISAFALAVLFSEAESIDTVGHALLAFARAAALALPLFLIWRYAIAIGRRQTVGAAFNVFALLTVGVWIILFFVTKGIALTLLDLHVRTMDRHDSKIATQVAVEPPTYESKGWTQETTGSTEVGPWLHYSPEGTRYFRDGNRVIYRLYPPGFRPDAEPANPFGLGDSTAEVPK